MQQSLFGRLPGGLCFRELNLEFRLKIRLTFCSVYLNICWGSFQTGWGVIMSRSTGGQCCTVFRDGCRWWCILSHRVSKRIAGMKTATFICTQHRRERVIFKVFLHNKLIDFFLFFFLLHELKYTRYTKLRRTFKISARWICKYFAMIYCSQAHKFTWMHRLELGGG